MLGTSTLDTHLILSARVEPQLEDQVWTLIKLPKVRGLEGWGKELVLRIAEQRSGIYNSVKLLELFMRDGA